MMPTARFPQDERHLLLHAPGLGEVIVERLEAAGLVSLSVLHAMGPDLVLERAGQGALRNRRRALARALAAAESASWPAATAHALAGGRP